MLESRQGLADALDDDFGLIAVVDAAGAAYELHQRSEMPAFAVGHGASPEHAAVRKLAGEPHELTGGPGLADAGLAADPDERRGCPARRRRGRRSTS